MYTVKQSNIVISSFTNGFFFRLLYIYDIFNIYYLGKHNKEQTFFSMRGLVFFEHHPSLIIYRGPQLFFVFFFFFYRDFEPFGLICFFQLFLPSSTSDTINLPQVIK